MSPSRVEASVPLEHLDDYLKAIVKVKLREFVHLSPWFQDIPSIDVNNYMRFESVEKPVQIDFGTRPESCPNRFHQPGTRTRRVRPLAT